jgi:MFS family permease
MSTFARGVIAAAPAWGWVLAGRVADRFGKGVRTTPRDALIRDSTPDELQGSAFGYHRAATDGVARGWIGDLVPAGSSRTAYGVFSLAAAGALLVSSLVAGALWSYVAPSAPFVVGAATAALTAVVLLTKGPAPARPV